MNAIDSIGPALTGMSPLAPSSALATDEKALRESIAVGGDRDKAEGLARELEALFVNMVIDEMRKATPQSEIFGKNSGEKIYSQMLDREYGKIMAQGFDPRFHETLVNQIVGMGARKEGDAGALK